MQTALKLFQKHQGVFRTRDALRAGIHPQTLYQLRDRGLIERMARGLYRLVDVPPLGNPDLVTVALKVPEGVVCLISALAQYELTTQIPHEVHLALPYGAATPRLEYPPLRCYRFSGKAFTERIETLRIDKIPVRVYSREKSIADAFKFRNQLGLDTVLEALKTYRRQGRVNVRELLACARICRVERVMKPYLEATL